jgi:hypothetical protein
MGIYFDQVGGQRKSFRIKGESPDPLELQKIESIKSQHATKITPAAAPVGSNTSYLQDVGSALKGGLGGLQSGAGWLLGSDSMQEGGQAKQAQAASEYSPESQKAREQGVFGGGGFRALGLGVAESAPAMAATIPATIAGAALLPEAAAVAVGGVALRVAPKLMKFLAGAGGQAQVGKAVVGALTGSSAEGLVTAGMNASDAQNTVLTLAKEQPEVFRNSPLGQKYLRIRGGNIELAARDAANEVARKVALVTGITTAAVALPGGVFEAGVLTGLGKSIAGRAARGAVVEGATEAVQSGAEQAIQNVAESGADPRIRPSQGVGRAIAEGAAIGGVMGGGFGAIAGAPADVVKKRVQDAVSQGEEAYQDLKDYMGPAPAQPAPKLLSNIKPDEDHQFIIDRTITQIEDEDLIPPPGSEDSYEPVKIVENRGKWELHGTRSNFPFAIDIPSIHDAQIIKEELKANLNDRIRGVNEQERARHQEEKRAYDATTRSENQAIARSVEQGPLVKEELGNIPLDSLHRSWDDRLHRARTLGRRGDKGHYRRGILPLGTPHTNLNELREIGIPERDLEKFYADTRPGGITATEPLAAPPEAPDPLTPYPMAQEPAPTYTVVQKIPGANGQVETPQSQHQNEVEAIDAMSALQQQNPEIAYGIKSTEPVGFQTFDKTTKAPGVKQGGFNPQSFKDLSDAITPGLRQRLNTMGLKDIALKLSSKISDMPASEAAYYPTQKLIRLATAFLDPATTIEQAQASLKATMDHEAIHALADLGFFTPQEYGALVKFVDKKKFVDQQGRERKFTYLEWATATYESIYTVDEARKNLPNGTDTDLQAWIQQAFEEEAIAEAFKVWANDPSRVPGQVGSIFRRILEFFKRLGAVFGESGADRIFQDIESGVLGQRGQVAERPAYTSPRPESARYSLVGKHFFSKAAEELKLLLEKKGSFYQSMPASQLRNYLKGRGVTDDEIKFGLGKMAEGDLPVDLKAAISRLEPEPYMLEEYGRGDMEESTPDGRYSDWAIPGGHNYKELLVKLDPSITPFIYKEPHWPGADNVMAHIRLQDFSPEYLDGRDASYTFIEELQSVMHQRGREEGYASINKSTDSNVANENFDNEAKGFLDWAKSVYEQASTQYSLQDTENFHEILNDGYRQLREGFTPHEIHTTLYHLSTHIDVISSEILHESNRRLTAVRTRMHEWERSNDQINVPDAPFKNNWLGPTLKLLFKWLAENGKTRVVFSPGELQSDRWGETQHDRRPAGEPDIPHYDKGKIDLYNKIVPQEAAKVLKLAGVQPKWFTQHIEDREDIQATGGYQARGIELSPGDIEKILATPFRRYSIARPSNGNIGIRAPEPTNPGHRRVQLEYAAAHRMIYDRVITNINNVARKAGKRGDLIPPRMYDNWVFLLQDNKIDLARLIDYVNKNGGNITDVNDVYLAFDLIVGAVTNEVSEANTTLYQPWVNAIRALGYAQQEIDSLKAVNPAAKEFMESHERRRGEYKDFGATALYMMAMHAKERNQFLRYRSTDLDPPIDSGSGLTDQDADQILAWFNSSPRYAQLRNVAEQGWAIIKNSNEKRVMRKLGPDFSSMPTPDDFIRAGLPNGFQYYVPLRGWLEEDALDHEDDLQYRKMLNMSVWGKEDISPVGRDSMAGEIIESIVHQNVSAISRGHRNEVLHKMVALIEETQRMPEHLRPQKMKILDKAPRKLKVVDGEIRWITDRMYKTRRDILIAKDGDHDIIMQVEDERIIRAFKGNDGTTSESANALIKMIARPTIFIGRLATSLNPEFMISNLVRDIFTAVGNAAQHQVNEKEIFTRVTKVIKALSKDASGLGTMTQDDTDIAEDFKLLKKLGGTTRDYNFSSFEDVMKAVHKTFQDQPNRFWQLKDTLVNYVETANNVMENATRVVTFQMMRSAVDAQGNRLYTDLQAADGAKNITVNFDKGGEWRQAANALFLFYNASIQGSFAMINAAVRSKKVRAILASITAMGALSDIINRLLSDDDDDGISHYTKLVKSSPWILERNMVLMIPGRSGYIKIPLPHGYGALYNLGRSTSSAIAGDISPIDAMTSSIGFLADSFNPLGGAHSFLNTVSPTILDPWIDVYGTNKDFAGRPIVPDKSPFGPDMPASQIYWNRTWAGYTWPADILHELTGGTDIIPGAIELSPNQIEHFVEYFTSGVGSLVRRTLQLGGQTLPGILSGDYQPEDVTANDVPLLRKIIGNISEREDVALFAKNRDSLLMIEKELKDAREDGDLDRLKHAFQKYGPVISRTPQFKAINNQRNAVIKQIRAIEDNPRIPNSVKKSMLKALRSRADQLVERGNQLVQ